VVGNSLASKNWKITKKPMLDTKIWQSQSLSEIREKLYEIPPSDFEGLIQELMH